MRKGIVMLLLLVLPVMGVRSQTLSQYSIANIAKSDPLIITGSIGTQNTFYHSTLGGGYRSPWANTVFANLNISLYGIAMPFSFYYSNNNSSFNYPHISFHIDPTYKNWRGHFGRSNIGMHPFIMNMSFNGVGVEYSGKRLRFGAFYGSLRNAVNDDPSDPKARTPQYTRLGWGFKVGYGTQRNFVDLYLLRAYDQQSSIDERWHDRVPPRENLAIALRGGLAVTNWLSLRGNLSFSAFTADTRSKRLESKQLDQWGDIFKARYSSLMRMATDLSAYFNLKGFNGSLTYRMVQPDYTTLGLYYTSNNYQSLGINLSTVLLGRLSLTASFSGQEDNITRNQLYTTRGFVYSTTATTQVGDRVTLSLGYNGYRQLQSDGKGHVNDTTRVNRVMHSLYLTPSYSLEGDNMNHIFSLSANYTENRDLNPFSNHVSDVRTIAAGIAHSMEVVPWETNFSTSFSHQQSKGYNTSYTSEVLSISTDRSFLKDKNLSASATVSLCLNDIKNQQHTFSIGFDISAGYMLKKVHVFNFAAGFNKYTDTNISTDNISYNTSEVNVTLGYVYTFSLLELKRKANKSNKQK